MRSGLPLVALLPWLAGCAFTLKLPLNRFESPEALGGFRPTIGAGIAGQSETVLTPDPLYTAPDPDAPTLVRASDLFLSAQVGLGRRLELQLRAPSTAQLKYQWLGSSQRENKEDQFSSAVTVGYGKLMREQTGTQLFSPDERRETSVNGTVLDAAMIFGTRSSELILFYGGPFVTLLSYSGTYVASNTSTGSRTESALEGTIRNLGANAGFEIAMSRFRLRAETALGLVSAGGASATQLAFGAMLGFTF
jgi:hypothetical protein